MSILFQPDAMSRPLSEKRPYYLDHRKKWQRSNRRGHCLFDIKQKPYSSYELMNKPIGHHKIQQQPRISNTQSPIALCPVLMVFL
jgi:hypothetical protein